jgi:hypothetical protein
MRFLVSLGMTFNEVIVRWEEAVIRALEFS